MSDQQEYDFFDSCEPPCKIVVSVKDRWRMVRSEGKKLNVDSMAAVCADEIIRLRTLNSSQAEEIEKAWSRNSQKMIELIAKDGEIAVLRDALAARDRVVEAARNLSESIKEDSRFGVAEIRRSCVEMVSLDAALAALAEGR